MTRAPFVLKIAIIAALFLFAAFLLAQEINLVTADLGRHLKNGELFFTHFFIPHANLYSYTFPDYPFVNHHWGSGAIFYLVEKLFGFGGISLLFLTVSLGALFLFFDIARRYARFEVATLLLLAALPVIGSRVEIRPEVFSYFFAGLFFWILWQWRENRVTKRKFFLLAAAELLWVNLHIYFFLGPLLLILFLSEQFITFMRRRDIATRTKLREGLTALVLVAIATLANPRGITGALYPLHIFNNYGYRLFENQSVWFIEGILAYPPALYFKILFAMLAASAIAAVIHALRHRRVTISPVVLFLSVIISVLGWTAVRNFALFGYFAIPLAALNLKNIVGQRSTTTLRQLFFLLLTLFIAGAALVAVNPSYWSTRDASGIGLKPGVERTRHFLTQERIKGPILNNYDNGGYLIYYLYPHERVFVDNRPEAYPAFFFQETYIPLQENEEQWREAQARFGFNAIIFYRHDLTPWAQKFLRARVTDPAWAPVFVDDYQIIFLKRGGSNQATIEKYELPRSMFSVRQQ